MTRFSSCKSAVIAVAVLALSGCLTQPATRANTAAIGPLSTTPSIRAQTGTCFGRAATPAVIETVREEILVQPASIRSDGTVDSPAIFRTVTRQRILTERREIEFATPCADVLTPQFVASVQRALAARDHYGGAITGQLDAATGAAIRAYQVASDDVNTDTLTLRSAQTLGLVVTPRDAL